MQLPYSLNNNSHFNLVHGQESTSGKEPDTQAVSEHEKELGSLVVSRPRDKSFCNSENY